MIVNGMFNELRQHPEWGDLLAHVSLMVDRAQISVLNEVRRGEIAAAQAAIGRHDALKELLGQLRGEM